MVTVCNYNNELYNINIQIVCNDSYYILNYRTIMLY